MALIARELLAQPKELLMEMLPQRFQLAFDDGTIIETKAKSVIYSNYFWDIHRAYPNTPLLSTHHVDSVLKGKMLSSSTHINLLSQIFEDVVATYNLHNPEQKEHLQGMVYEVTNNVYNEVTKMAEEYVSSIDILDFIEVIDHPGIKDAVDNVQPNHESISACYDKVLHTINSSPDLKDNALVRAIRSGSVNSNQVMQCVAVRGFPAEVDGTIMQTPILTNYTKGMKNLYHYAADSRSAAKSLYFSEAPLQDAEYFARRLQLLSMTVERIAYTDCGTTNYLHWRVMPPTYNEANVKTYPGDLAFMTGKYYLDEDSNTLKEITHDDPKLYNKVLKLRSVVFCQHQDKHAVCEVCFGALSKNISRYANLGHLCSATMTQQTSQSVLSTKHLDASSVSANIVLGELNRRFLLTNKAKNSYLIKKEYKDKNIRLIINREEVPGLVDIMNVMNVQDINPARISSIESIELVYQNNGEETAMSLLVNQGNRRAVLTNEFLKYLKQYRWQTDSKNNFVFDLEHWDFNQPILRLPDMEYSYSDHSHQIARVIESNMKNITERALPNSPISTLQELFSLVNTKLKVNIAALEVIIYAIMLPGRDDYNMARGKEAPVMGIANLVIKNRSLSSAYAFEDQINTITGARSFFKLDRPDSIFDVFIAPEEVIEYHNRMTH